eukprot:526001-Rhodomonas_salina.1
MVCGTVLCPTVLRARYALSGTEVRSAAATRSSPTRSASSSSASSGAGLCLNLYLVAQNRTQLCPKLYLAAPKSGSLLQPARAECPRVCTAHEGREDADAM